MSALNTAEFRSGSAPDIRPEIAAPRVPEPPTHFAFEHRVFSIKGAWFGLSSATGEPCFHVLLGESPASVPIDKMAVTFEIGKSTSDIGLLDIVKRSLRFVREIRPGDSIPTEILDGTASWKVEPHHREVASARVSMQLVSWLSGKELQTIDAGELEAMASLSETKKKVQEAFTALAEKLGIGDKQEVVGRIEDLARELSYIEALREQFAKIQKLFSAMTTLTAVYRSERSFVDDIQRVRILLKKPVEDLSSIFDQIDANTGEILSVMKKFDSQVRYIRENRDELHCRMMKWDGVLQEWKGVVPERSGQVESLIKITYRFAARYFPQVTTWSLQSR